MTITGSCHCGQTAFEIDGELPEKLTRCTCSICSRKGYLFAYFRPEQFRLLRSNQQATYRWNTKKVAHNFCGNCGCATFVDSPEFQPDGTWDGHTRRIGASARLFDDFDAAETPVTVLDGKNLW